MFVKQTGAQCVGLVVVVLVCGGLTPQSGLLPAASSMKTDEILMAIAVAKLLGLFKNEHGQKSKPAVGHPVPVLVPPPPPRYPALSYSPPIGGCGRPKKCRNRFRFPSVFSEHSFESYEDVGGGDLYPGAGYDNFDDQDELGSYEQHGLGSAYAKQQPRLPSVPDNYGLGGTSYEEEDHSGGGKSAEEYYDAGGQQETGTDYEQPASEPVPSDSQAYQNVRQPGSETSGRKRKVKTKRKRRRRRMRPKAKQQPATAVKVVTEVVYEFVTTELPPEREKIGLGEKPPEEEAAAAAAADQARPLDPVGDTAVVDREPEESQRLKKNMLLTNNNQMNRLERMVLKSVGKYMDKMGLRKSKLPELPASAPVMANNNNNNNVNVMPFRPLVAPPPVMMPMVPMVPMMPPPEGPPPAEVVAEQHIIYPLLRKSDLAGS